MEFFVSLNEAYSDILKTDAKNPTEIPEVVYQEAFSGKYRNLPFGSSEPQFDCKYGKIQSIPYLRHVHRFKSQFCKCILFLFFNLDLSS